MKPAPFRYYDPTTLSEAIALLSTLDNARLLAGGQSLGPMLNMRFATPDHVIDLNGVADLAYIRDAEDHLAIGSMTRQRDLEFSAVIKESCPLLQEALRFVGHRQTRNRGTIGGSLCHLDPAAELVCVCRALDAVVEARSPRGARLIAFADFPAGYMSPALEPDEILCEIRVPKTVGLGTAFVEFARRHGDFAIVSAAAIVALDDAGAIAGCALALGGLDVAPVRAEEAEAALAGERPNEAAFARAGSICRSLEALEDAYAPRAYRQRLAGVLAQRALTQACAKASAAKGTTR
jgi:carbon-monoxide dehydrogenase medium subunit